MKIKKILACLLIVSSLTIMESCENLLELSSETEITDSSSWQTAEDFAKGTNKFYEFLPKIMTVSDASNARDGIMQRDLDADLESNWIASTTVSTSSLNDDNSYNRYLYETYYTRIREVNFILERANKFENQDAIKQYIGECYFFRAFSSYLYFRDFGPGIIVKKVLDVDSEELTSTQASRLDFFNWMIEDLTTSLNYLTPNAELATDDIGRITKEAAEALISRLYLFEGSWQKYHYANIAKSSTDSTFFELAASYAQKVIDSNQFQLFTNSSMGTDSYRWMFILESSEQCNPYKILKNSNNEYILRNRFDESIKQSGTNISHTAQSYYATRKMVEMYLDSTGLPIEKSQYYKGYTAWNSFLQARDPRLKNCVGYVGQQVWSYGINGRVDWTGGTTDKITQLFVSGDKKAFRNLKWVTERAMNVTEDGFDVPIIRLAEMYLTYAEAIYEANGSITDEQLAYSLNKVRARAGMPDLTNSFVTDNGLNMLTEIRRERTVEFYLEGLRLDDLRRWATAETEMSANIEGFPYIYKGVNTIYSTASQTFYLVDADGNTYLNSRNRPLVSMTYKKTTTTMATYDDGSQYVLFEAAANRPFESKHYLRPIPYEEFDMNPNLKQNPGWE